MTSRSSTFSRPPVPPAIPPPLALPSPDPTTLAQTLPEDDPVRHILLRSTSLHAPATLPPIASGNYEEEHWLATFAVYPLTE